MLGDWGLQETADIVFILLYYFCIGLGSLHTILVSSRKACSYMRNENYLYHTSNENILQVKN